MFLPLRTDFKLKPSKSRIGLLAGRVNRRSALRKARFLICGIEYFLRFSSLTIYERAHIERSVRNACRKTRQAGLTNGKETHETNNR
jgi:hypothetical protein